MSILYILHRVESYIPYTHVCILCISQSGKLPPLYSCLSFMYFTEWKVTSVILMSVFYVFHRVESYIPYTHVCILCISQSGKLHPLYSCLSFMYFTEWKVTSVILMSVFYVIHRRESYLHYTHVCRLCVLSQSGKLPSLYSCLFFMYFTEWDVGNLECQEGQTYDPATGSCGNFISFILPKYLTLEECHVQLTNCYGSIVIRNY